MSSIDRLSPQEDAQVINMCGCQEFPSGREGEAGGRSLHLKTVQQSEEEVTQQFTVALPYRNGTPQHLAVGRSHVRMMQSIPVVTSQRESGLKVWRRRRRRRRRRKRRRKRRRQW